MTIFRSVIILTGLALALACGTEPGVRTNSNTKIAVVNSTPQPSATAPVDLMARGRKLYSDNCAVCHKDNGKGGKIEIEGRSINPDDLTSDKIKAFSDEKIYGYIYKGIEDEGMPSFKDKLSEAEIREVVRYLRAEIQQMPESAPKTQ